MNTTAKYQTYYDFNYPYYTGNTALNVNDKSDTDNTQEVVAIAEDYSNTNLLDLPKDFKLNGY